MTQKVSFLARDGENDDVARARLRREWQRAAPERSVCGHPDSLQKVVSQLATLAPDPVAYNGKRVLNDQVNTVLLAPALFRCFTCVAGCTACCVVKFTLDFIPDEFAQVPPEYQTHFAPRQVMVNDVTRQIYTSDQRTTSICHFLSAIRPDKGLGCALWPLPPLSCQSAPQLGFSLMRAHTTYITKRPFGRAWAMALTPQCDFSPVETIDAAGLEGDIALLDRFQRVADYFELETVLPLARARLRALLDVRTAIPTHPIEVWTRD